MLLARNSSHSDPASLAASSAYQLTRPVTTERPWDPVLPGINKLVMNLRRLPSLKTGLGLSLLLLVIFAVVLESSLVAGLPTNARPVIKHHYQKHNSGSHHPHRHQHHHRRPSTTPKPVPSLEAIDESSSLSIVTPLEVLRRNMIQEINRNRVRHAESKVLQSNREFLEKIG